MKFFLIRSCLALMFCVYSIYCSAQRRQQLYDSVSRLVQAAYNTEDPMKMYALTAPAYKERMAATAFSDGTKKFYIKVGKWKDLQFKEDTGEGIAYTAQFERDKQVFFLQLDEQARIIRFNFKSIPFVKSTKNYQVPCDNPMKTAMDSLVEKLVRPYIQQGHTVGVSIAIIRKNIVDRYNYGEVQKGMGKLPDPKATIFEIGSVTKTFTSLLLATEVYNKKMKLNDPISKYLPDSIPLLHYKNTAITLQNLANHTSGFPRLPANIFLGNINPSDPYRHYNQDSLFSFLLSYQPSVMPGTQFSYSNYGAGLLGCILARYTGKSFEQLIVERICRPLKMNDTRIELAIKGRIRFAQGYNEKGEATAPWNLAALQGSGAIRSTLNDMVRYTQAQLSDRSPLASAISLTHQVSFRSKDNTMGLGWRIEQDQDHTYWHHSGGTGGFRSFVGFDKKQQLGIVILSNTAEDVTALGQAILVH